MKIAAPVGAAVLIAGTIATILLIRRARRLQLGADDGQ